MQIKHKSYNFNVTAYRTILGHLKGLIFKIIRNDGAILIFSEEKEISVHTFFVFYSLDLIFLNKEKSIIKIVNNVKPFSILNKIRAKYVLELKNKNNLKLNEILDF